MPKSPSEYDLSIALELREEAIRRTGCICPLGSDYGTDHATINLDCPVCGPATPASKGDHEMDHNENAWITRFSKSVHECSFLGRAMLIDVILESEDFEDSPAELESLAETLRDLRHGSPDLWRRACEDE